MTRTFLSSLALVLLALGACRTAARPGGDVPVPDAGEPTARRILGERSFLTGYAPRNSDGTVNVVVAMPAGTTAMWDVVPSGMLEWRREDGLPAYLRYIACPANLGTVPRTRRRGSDAAAPLDVVVLGAAAERGRVIRTRPVAVLELVEDGVRDDHIVAVPDGTVFAEVRDLEGLRRAFPGTTEIVETWLLNRLGPDHRVLRVGWGDAARAAELLEASIRDFDARGG